MMRVTLRQFAALARLTLLETLRQPVTLLLTLSLVGLTALLPVVVSHTLGEQGKMMSDSALALFLTGGILFAAFAAGGGFGAEIRGGTAATVLSKPVGRGTFYLARYAGLAAALLLYAYDLLVATLLSARIAAPAYTVDLRALLALLAAPVLACALAGLTNFWLRRPFNHDAFLFLQLTLTLALVYGALVDESGQWTPFGRPLTWTLVPAGGLLAAALLVFGALALALATRLEPLPALLCCLVVLLAGLMSDYLLGRAAATSRAAAWAYRIVPNWNHFWVADALHDETPIPWTYVRDALGYAAAYIAGLLSLGLASFRHREVRA